MDSPVKSWSLSRYNTFIISSLRGAFRKFPNKYETLKEASVGKKLNPKSKRMAEHFICKSCGNDFPAKEVQVDHILPVVCPKKGFKDWNTFIDRLFCDKDNLQVLCGACHDVKTALERGERNGNKK